MSERVNHEFTDGACLGFTLAALIAAIVSDGIATPLWATAAAAAWAFSILLGWVFAGEGGDDAR